MRRCAFSVIEISLLPLGGFLANCAPVRFYSPTKYRSSSRKNVFNTYSFISIIQLFTFLDLMTAFELRIEESVKTKTSESEV